MGKGTGMEKALSSGSINMQKFFVLSSSFSYSAAFQGKAFHVFLNHEYNWITSPLSGESYLVREPCGLLKSFYPLKEAVLICHFNETCVTQCSSLRPTVNWTMCFLSSLHGGTNMANRSCTSPAAGLYPSVSNCHELSYVMS